MRNLQSQVNLLSGLPALAWLTFYQSWSNNYSNLRSFQVNLDRTFKALRSSFEPVCEDLISLAETKATGVIHYAVEALSYYDRLHMLIGKLDCLAKAIKITTILSEMIKMDEFKAANSESATGLVYVENLIRNNIAKKFTSNSDASVDLAFLLVMEHLVTMYSRIGEAHHYQYDEEAGTVEHYTIVFVDSSIGRHETFAEHLLKFGNDFSGRVSFQTESGYDDGLHCETIEIEYIW